VGELYSGLRGAGRVERIARIDERAEFRTARYVGERAEQESRPPGRWRSENFSECTAWNATRQKLGMGLLPQRKIHVEAVSQRCLNLGSKSRRGGRHIRLMFACTLLLQNNSNGVKKGGALKSGYMAHPVEFTDTDPRAMEVWLELLRGKTPGERIAAAFNLTDFALRMAESGVRANHPGASEREIFLRAAALRLPRDLMIRAYGWDPGQPFEEKDGHTR
jgi:hypothetical protein